jgi:transcription-repair coupling factor (superfamily II helicase)
MCWANGLCVPNGKSQETRVTRSCAASVLGEGDYIVHAEHGIGRFAGLTTVTAAGAPHECAELHYAGGDKLFLPVENIDLLSRYGAEDTAVALDKLGGVAWQASKARLKERIREMAGKLIDIAAKRALRKGRAASARRGPVSGVLRPVSLSRNRRSVVGHRGGR